MKRILLLILSISTIAWGQTTVRIAGGSIGSAQCNQSAPASVGNAWPIKLTDATNVAAVKAASTSAATTDPAAVVALSPNSALPAGANLIGKAGIDQTTPGSTNAVVPVPIAGSASALSSAALATLTASASVKALAGNVYAIAYQNGAASACWVECVDSAGAGTLGTAPVFSIPMGANGVGFVEVAGMALGQFSTGIACGIATAPSGATPCGTAGNVTVFYK